MDTPPNVTFFIEIALLRLGKEIVDGLDLKERTQEVNQIVDYWMKRKEIEKEVRNQLLVCWKELVLNVRVREIELEIRRSESRQDTQDVHEEVRLLYIDYCECVGGCLDSLAS